MKKAEIQVLCWLHLGRFTWLISVEDLLLAEVQTPMPPKAVEDYGAVTDLPVCFIVGILKTEQQQNPGFELVNFHSCGFFLITYVISWFI